MSDGIGLAEKMLGLPGLVVLDVEEGVGEVVVRVESTRCRAFCPSCRRRAEAQDRVEVHLRDVHCFGRPCRLVCASAAGGAEPGAARRRRGPRRRQASRHATSLRCVPEPR